MRIVIPFNAIAKKNSQRIVRFGKRKISIRPSKAYDNWEKNSIQYLEGRVQKWSCGYPVELKFFFYRKTKMKFDFSNMLEGVQDILQKLNVINDDDMNHVIPVIDKRGDKYGWDIDKENPRIEIEIRPVHIYAKKIQK